MLFMSRHRKLNQFCQEIDKINTHLCLELPASAKTIRRKIRSIHRLQVQLETMQSNMQAIAKRYRQPQLRQIYRILLMLVAEMISEAKSFKLLAEEFSADSEGTISCLQSVNQRKRLRQEHYLRILGRIECLDLEPKGWRQNFNNANSAIVDFTDIPDLDFALALNWL